MDEIGVRPWGSCRNGRSEVVVVVVVGQGKKVKFGPSASAAEVEQACGWRERETNEEQCACQLVKYATVS